MKAARERLLANPQDDLKDLIMRLASEEDRIEKRCRAKVLRQLIIEALFGDDLKSARQALIKCYTLKPSRQVNSVEAARLLQVVWGHWILVFKEDIDELIDDMGRSIEADEAVKNGELYS